ncbi:uncharacterized MFS-type transporter C18.02 [Aspergillus lentulus]|uniref:Uncharacterized MFS-type transporter C18.02 n=1 Tax=Aspergillus lentulus TaxID=293939 RepID=A0AAN4T6E2_ASPLE|nr:uncharacterized MFS-type transporter C18.02 [Aspergillus lentulus]
MAAIIQSRLLGEIRGKAHDGVSQFLGIQYATLKDRLADAELIEQREGNILDASKDGPTAVSPSFGCDFELGHIQHTLPKKELPQSDLNCLNLNITVPAGTTETSNLPVFLFIHGGGLVLGANSWPQFDYARFVKLSVEKNLPIVAVSMNYRLGAFGFLTSDELRRAGYNANNGLRDQKVAMRWVQKHIANFGGDPDNVTLAGMSAGGACVTYHLDSDEQLFKRAIVMSGTCLLIKPLPYDLHEQNYQQAIAALGLADASPGERIKTLLETPGEDLVAKIPPTVLAVPAIDGDMVSSAVTYAQVAGKGSSFPRGKNWCEDLVIGDAQMDASIMAFLMSHTKKDCARKFVTAMNTVLASQSDVAQKILAKYNITKDMTDDKAFPTILNYVNDIAFFAPVLAFAKGWKNNVYVYDFNEGNPWDGPWKDRASHILDLAYLFQNFREFMSQDQQQLAITFAEDFFKFCHGVKPWPAIAQIVEAGFTARVYGPAPNVGQVNGPHDEGSLRRSILFDHADQVSLDEFAKLDLIPIFAMVLGGLLSKHEGEPKRPILLELRSSRVFVIFVVSFATFTDTLLYGLIVPVTPTALHERVGLSEDDEQSWTSILLALYGAALLAASREFDHPSPPDYIVTILLTPFFFNSAISGYLADRIESRRWPLLIGLVALGASTALLCVGTTLGLWIAGRLFQGVSAAVVWTVGLALLVDTMEKEAIGEAMGYAAMGITLGTMTGPLLGGVLYEKGGYYAVFALAFGIIGLDIFLRLVLIEKKDALKWLDTGKLITEPGANPTKKQTTDGRVPLPCPTDERDSNARHEHDVGSSSTPRDDTNGNANQQMPRKRRFGAVITLLASDRMLVTLWAYFIVAVALTSLDSVLPLFVQDTFGWKQTAQGLVFIPVSVPHILDPFFGYINDKFPQARRFVVSGALLITVPLFVLLRLVTTNSMSQKVVLCVLLALIGLCLAFLIPPLFVEASYIVQEKEAESPGVFGKGGAMALAYGILNSAFAAGSMVGPFLAGFIRESAGWGTMSWVIGLLMGVSAIPMLLFLGGPIWKPTERHAESQSAEAAG